MGEWYFQLCRRCQAICPGWLRDDTIYSLSLMREIFIERGQANIKNQRHTLTRFPAASNRPTCSHSLAVSFGRLPPIRPLALAASSPARVRSTMSSRSISAGHPSHERKTPHRRAGINSIRQTAKINAAFAQFLNQNYQMPHTTPQPVQLPDYQSVTC